MAATAAIIRAHTTITPATTMTLATTTNRSIGRVFTAGTMGTATTATATTATVTTTATTTTTIMASVPVIIGGSATAKSIHNCAAPATCEGSRRPGGVRQDEPKISE